MTGVGTHLKGIIEKEALWKKMLLKSMGSDKCLCEDMESELNGMGVSKCKRQRPRIVSHLVSQAEEFARSKILAKAARPIERAVAASWVDAAISSAEAEPGNEEFTAAWVYWHQGSLADELRYSMRSVDLHVQQVKNIVLCGDRPPWFDGTFIESPKLTSQQAQQMGRAGGYHKEIDSIAKLQKLVNCPEVTDKFLWMYDDTFVLKGTTLNWLAMPRADHVIPVRPRSGNHWMGVRERTRQMLQDAGLPQWDYSSHFPIVYEKDKLQETLERFNPIENPCLIESLYMNHHYPRPARKLGDQFLFVKTPRAAYNPSRQVVVTNVGQFNQHVRPKIRQRFKKRSYVEKPQTQLEVPVVQAVNPGSPSTVTGILNTFRRPHTLDEQVRALKPQVNEIMVWGNGNSRRSSVRCRIQYAASSANLGVWARFAYALNATTEYVCVFDDDTIPGSRWIENCLRTIEKCGGLVGAAGIRFNNRDRYDDCEFLGWRSPSNEIVKVDIVGHAWFFRREWLAHYWANLPPKDHPRLSGEDFHFSYVLQKQGIASFVAPHPPGDKSMWGSTKGQLGSDAAALSRRKETRQAIHHELTRYTNMGFKLLCEHTT